MRWFRATLTSPIVLKVTSLIIGFLLWRSISDLFTQSLWVTVPVCFYNSTPRKIDAPETIAVELVGKRSHMRQISKDTLAVHIDAETLQPGTNQLTISRDQLLLPPSISVATVIPHVVTAYVRKGDLS